MRKHSVTLLISTLLIFLAFGCQNAPEAASPAKTKEEALQPAQKAAADQQEQNGPNGCDPEFRALYDHARVELTGKGDLDVVVITDPLCWHCRLGHKLLSEYPEKYGKLRLIFFPRRSFIGSDMAAWIIEDVAGTDKLKPYLDFAYSELLQPKTKDLTEARMLVLAHFTQTFPEMLEGTTIEDLYVRLQADHEAHVLESAELSRMAQIPGTPVLVAGEVILIGFGPGPWLKALDDMKVCK